MVTDAERISERVARVEGVLEEVRNRLDDLQTRIGNLEGRVQTQLYWIIGVMLAVLIPMWVTIILAI